MTKIMQGPDPYREKEHMEHSPYSSKYLVYILGETKLENWDIMLENSSCV